MIIEDPYGTLHFMFMCEKWSSEFYTYDLALEELHTFDHLDHGHKRLNDRDKNL